jgi:hypothetical protein
MLKYIIISLLITTNFLFAKANYVEATGYGNTKEDALKSAFSDAVSQYIGVLVDSKSITKNGKLIEDKILTFSNGYIKDYKVLKSFQKVGLWQVTINALVKEQDVMDKIIKEKISSKDIKNSNQRYAKLVSQINTKFQAENILKDTFKDLMSWETTKIYNTPKITEFEIDEDGATRRFVPVKIYVQNTFNEAVYTKITSQLQSLFKKLGGKKVKKFDTKKDKALLMISFDGYISRYMLRHSKKYQYWKFPNSYKVIYPFGCGNTFRAYPEEQDDGSIRCKDFTKQKKWSKHYTINFLDKKNNILKSIKYKQMLSLANHGIFGYFEHDYYNVPAIGKTSRGWRYAETFKIPLEVIKKLSRVEVKWVD